jgi:hypothetical protein
MRTLLPVYIRARGGLGNQLSFLIEGLSTATKTKRKLWIDLRYSGSSNNSFSKLASITEFQINTEIKTRYIVNTDTKIEKIICQILYLLNYCYFNLRKTKNSTTMFISTKSHFEGKSVAHLLSNKGLIQEFYHKSPSKRYRELLDILNNKRIISLHYRYGDFVDWHNGRYIISPDKYLELITHLQKVDEKIAREIWVFTDDVEKFNSNFSPNFKYKVISSETLSDSEQLMLFSKSYYMIGSHSTFSFWACVLHKSQNTVYVPIDSLTMPGWKVYY